MIPGWELKLGQGRPQTEEHTVHSNAHDSRMGIETTTAAVQPASPAAIRMLMIPGWELKR